MMIRTITASPLDDAPTPTSHRKKRQKKRRGAEAHPPIVIFSGSQPKKDTVLFALKLYRNSQIFNSEQSARLV